MKLYVRSGIIVILILSLKMILTTNSCSTINVNACTKVIKAVQRHFNSACVIIIQNDGEGFLAHMKFLAASQLIYSTIFLNNIMTTNLRKLQCHFKEPLYILPSSDDQTKKLLEKLSAEDYLSRSKWLLFLNSAKIEEFFISIHVPFDCEFLVAQFSDAAELSLTEVYRTRADLPLHSLRIAEENAGRELMWSNVSFIQRRGNLEGLVIRGSVVEHVLLYRIKKSNDSKSFQAEGFINDIWNELQRRMNFRTNYSFPEDKAFGSFQNGSWTGVIGMIAKREADVGLSTFSFTRERIEVVDFFPPIWNFRQRVYIKEIGIEEGNPSKIFSTFSSTMWGATAVTMLGLTLVLAAVLKVAEADLTQQHLRIRDTWFYVFVIFCQQGQHGMPRSWSCRIVYMTSYFTAILLFVSFSAIFISFLTVRKEVVPFTDFQDLINDGTYKVGVLARSAHQDYFQS
ncbi:glutamate receptor ionotropic, delta-1-like isoform X2 [Periplaneta americana]|uniref:glutamate receptor ionotropic, delta-1-like isoform X2 n=1 Tax=Periplaneta americana TaxID=6978 RepID=UPI0037E7D9AE